MTINIISKFSELPEEIKIIIMNYSDVIIFRYGKYMNRISKTDIRYNKINSMPKPLKYCPNEFMLPFYYKYNELDFVDKVYDGFIYYYKYNPNENIMRIKKTYFYTIGSLYSYGPTIENYIIDSNGLWRKIVNYTM
jgi:hypothetical protein